MARLSSRHLEQDGQAFGNRLAMLDAIRQDAEPKGLDAGNGLRRSRTVDEDAGQVGDLGQPSAVVFAFDLDG